MKTRIKEFVSKFELLNKRDSEEGFMIYKGNPDIISEIHGPGMFPDDFRYEKICRLAETFLEYDFNSYDDLRDNYLHEIVDGLIDLYHSDLFAWLSSNLIRQDYVNLAVDELGLSTKRFDIADVIRAGQYFEILELANNLISTLESDNEL